MLSGRRARDERQWLKVVHGFNGMLTLFVSISVIMCTFTDPPMPDECCAILRAAKPRYAVSVVPNPVPEFLLCYSSGMAS
jgi:hypothetical protein